MSSSGGSSSRPPHDLERLADRLLSGRNRPAPVTRGAGIRGLLDNGKVHERIPEHVDPGLRWLAWLSIVALTAEFFIVSTWGHAHDGLAQWGITHWAVSGFGNPALAQWICALVIAAALAGAMVTRGFTRATSIGHNGLIVLVCCGILAAIPTAWLVIVIVGIIVLYILIAIGIVALVIGLLVAALD